MACQHLGKVQAKSSHHPPVYFCNNSAKSGHAICMTEDAGVKTLDGALVNICSEKCPGFVVLELTEISSPHRPKGNFAYVTMCTRPTGPLMISAMVKQFRAVGIVEDVHAWTIGTVEGAINHQASRAAFNYMMKVDIIRELAKSSNYVYLVFVDSDTWAIRDVPNYDALLRNNSIFVQMEGEWTAPGCRRGDWWGIPFPKIIDVMRRFGCGQRAWNTNAGLFIVRRDTAEEFSTRMYTVYEQLRSMGFKAVTEEPPLAILGHTMVSDPENNTIEKTSSFWGCDWAKHFNGRFPDGNPWPFEDWINGKVTTIDPALVHLMGNKNVMLPEPLRSKSKAAAQPTLIVKEPVGTKLAEIFSECGVQRPANCDCNKWTALMNQGVEWTRAHRHEIVTHLNEASKQAGWLAMAKVAVKGYLTVDSLIDEAIKRATKQIAKAA